MKFLAVGAFLYGMVLKEAGQVPSLAGRKDSGAAAQRAGAVEGGQNGRADKAGPVGNTVHGTQ